MGYKLAEGGRGRKGGPIFSYFPAPAVIEREMEDERESHVIEGFCINSSFSSFSLCSPFSAVMGK